MTTNNSQVECLELFMLDTSTSIVRRDGFWNFREHTRFEVAKTFVSQVLKCRKESQTIKVGLVTYDTTSVKNFGFCHITKQEIYAVDELEPYGSKTATYDAYKDCVEYLQKTDFQNAQQQRIVIITDGGDNSSARENVEKYKNLQLHRQKEHLMIRTILLHTSENNDGSKELAHVLGWEYKQLRKTNVDSAVQGYLIDYPAEYTGMKNTERKKTRRVQAIMKTAPVPPETTPILQENPSSKRTEKKEILLTEIILD